MSDRFQVAVPQEDRSKRGAMNSLKGHNRKPFRRGRRNWKANEELRTAAGFQVEA